ncbi:MAG: helix-turn-helix transcriptional regulator [Clostridia bacterium]|nr:helix-turn-helix transcriptional regulator [Clostridia bacterium]
MEITLSENIRAFRKQRSLTQEQLSEALGVTPGAVYKWEAGLSVPELPVIVMLADFFDTSVDVLLGYKIRSNSMDAISDRLNTYVRNSDPAALPEAEKALKKYPNSFTVVHGCAQVYNVFGSENHDPVYLRRALELYEQALLLIPQNTASQVSEYTIYGEIGGIYTLMGEPEKGVEILKKHNTGGMFDEAIGETLALFLNRTEEAMPFLSGALLDCVIRLWGCVIGFGAVFSARKDYASVQEIARWGLEVLSGIRNAGQMAAVLTVLLAHAQLHMKNAEDARDSLRKAAALAASFDASPFYGISAFRFVSAPKEGSVHDGMGGTAGESVAFILDKLRDPDLASLWEEVRNSVPPQAEEGGKKHESE